MDEQLPDGTDLLMSILPMHAARIYSGRKIFELRKVLPRELPRRIFLYETERGIISGHVVVEKIISASPKTLWNTTGPRGTTKERFFRYFGDATIGHAYKISHAVKYREPLKVNGGAKDENHPVPQSFLYVESLPRLHRILKEKALIESFQAKRGSLKCQLLSENNEREFVRLVDKHISGSYLETGKKYARKLIEVHSKGEDTEGIFSQRKVILEITARSRLAGFCVLTEKVGGCIKTGPVVFKERFVKKGLGQKLRGNLHAALSAAGFRKVYCTVPAINDAAVHYLLASAYRIEAHLQRQYHDGHDEFVLGFPLVSDRISKRDFTRDRMPASDIFRMKKPSLSLATFIQQEFSSTYCKLPTDWAARQLQYASGRSTKSKFKPREIYIAQTGGEILCVALCIPKRGGATKVLLASRTNHADSLARTIRKIESDFKGSKTRKLYSLVSVFDLGLQRALYQCGFQSEGILDRPYQASDDLIVLSKMLS